MNSRYIYNSEPIAVIALATVLSHLKHISYSKTMLILPIVLNDRLIKFISLGSSKVRSIDELIIKKGNELTGFNEFYLELLPITINALLILSEMSVVNIENGYVKYNENRIDLNNNFGKRANKIIKAANKVAKILNEDEQALYLQLRVRI